MSTPKGTPKGYERFLSWERQFRGVLDQSPAAEAARATKRQDDVLDMMSKGMSGDVELKIFPEGPLSVPAARANAAAAGTLKFRLAVVLVDAGSKRHPWARFTPPVSTAESVADIDVGAPTVDPATPKLKNGYAELWLVLDTDAGATKTYAAADSVTCTFKVSADGTLLGAAVADAVLTVDFT